MQEQPTLEEQIAFFDRWNDTHRKQGFEEVEHESKARAERVLEILDSLRITGASILEVGCGTGWLTEKLTGYGAATGIDLSPRAIEIANARGMRANFLAGDFFELDLPAAPFDVVVCLETISSVPDQLGFVEKLAMVTRPGGCLIITSQNKFVYDRRADIAPPLPGNVRKWLTRKQLMGLLTPRFEILKSTTVLPKGHKGILRLINSYKLNGLLDHVIPPRITMKAKEKLGLGHTRVILARRRKG